MKPKLIFDQDKWDENGWGWPPKLNQRTGISYLSKGPVLHLTTRLTLREQIPCRTQYTINIKSSNTQLWSHVKSWCRFRTFHPADCVTPWTAVADRQTQCTDRATPTNMQGMVQVGTPFPFGQHSEHKREIAIWASLHNLSFVRERGCTHASHRHSQIKRRDIWCIDLMHLIATSNMGWYMYWPLYAGQYTEQDSFGSLGQ